MITQTKAKIVSNPLIMCGTPVVEGTRVPAENILAAIRDGASRNEIFKGYPSLPADGIDACLNWEKSGKVND
jgi:uncharacterized protein (DUF433 family)